MKKQPIPLWRSTIYSLFFAVVPGIMMLSGSVQWKPLGLLMTALACTMAWVHGRSNGKRAVLDIAINELAKIHKQVDEHIAKTNQKIDEGEEWKRGSDLEEPREP